MGRPYTEIRSVRRVHAAPGPKTKTDGDHRSSGERRKIAGTSGVGGRSFWRQVLDGRERLLPARPYKMPYETHTFQHAVGLSLAARICTRAKTSPGRCAMHLKV